jgi:hypothetical protein
MEEALKSPISLRLLLGLLESFQRLEPDVKGIDRDKVTIKARFEHEGISFFAVALPSFCDSLDRGLSEGRFACPLGFSRIRGGALPKLFSGLLCKVFDPKTGSLKESPCQRAVKCLREALIFFKKCVTANGRAEQLHREAVSTFWDAELGCSQSVFDGDRLVLLSRVAGTTLTRLGLFDPRRVVPRHGPGAVYERVGGNQKWSSACRVVRQGLPDTSYFGIDTFLASCYGAEEGLISADNVGILADTCAEFETRDFDAPSSGSSFGRSSRLVTVPKSAVARRTITVEPLWNMFIQQGLNSWLRKVILRCPVLSSSLDLADQRHNQNLSLEGSRTGKWSTLDLSSASDLLSLRLVEVVFGRHSMFFEAMVMCRSSWVEDDVRKASFPVKKFAGMGNALTFPVQSVVFALIAIAAILNEKGRSRPSYGEIKRTAKIVRVYGDDIIVPTRYSRQVMDWIESFGLKVNRKKSFTTGNFRESCGLDAFMGVDVTPTYIRDDPDNPSIDASALSSLVSTSNQLWLKGLYEPAIILQEHVEKKVGRPLPLVGKESGALGWHSRVDACHAQRWDDKLQRLVLRAPVLVTETFRDHLDGYPALLKFFLTPLIQRGKRHLKQSEKRYSVRLKWKWIPAQVGVQTQRQPIEDLTEVDADG